MAVNPNIMTCGTPTLCLFCEAALQLTRSRNQTLTNIKKEVELTCADSIDAVIENKYRGTILEPHMRTFLLGVTTSALAEFIPDVTAF